MNVIVLSALDTSCRDAGLEHLRRHYPEAIILSYDFIEGNRLVRTVAGNAAAEHGEAVLEHPCIGCAVKYEIFPAIERLAPQDNEATMLLGLPATWHSGSVLETLAQKLATVDISINSIALSLDPTELEDHMWDKHSLWESGFSSMERDQRTAGEFFFTELMQADTVLPVEGMHTRLLESPKGPRRIGGEDFDTGLGVVQQMAPHATICSHDSQVGSFNPGAAQQRTSAGHIPDISEASSPTKHAPIHLIAERPLHPERFREALPALAATCTCIRGRLWVASALSERVAIGSAGPRLWMENTGSWSTEIATSELLLYGSEHEANEITNLFHQCQVTEEELQGLFSAS